MPVKGSCHCKATQFVVDAAPATVTRCTCSFCSRRGGLWAYYKPEQFRLLTARDRVATYQWGSYTGQHHHCPICGCGTYSESPSWVNGQADYDNPQVSVNARLFDDFDLDAVEVVVIDGKNLW